jgi:hypothetical protein
VCGAGAARAAALAPATTAHGDGLTGLGCKRSSGLGFKSGLHGKNAGATETASRGSVGQAGAREGSTMVVHGRGTTVRRRVREGKAKGKNRPARFLTPRRYSGEAIEERRDGDSVVRPRCGSGGLHG